MCKAFDKSLVLDRLTERRPLNIDGSDFEEENGDILLYATYDYLQCYFRRK